MNHQATALTDAHGPASRQSKRAFGRHFGEMLLAMFAGMLVLGGISEVAFAFSGSSLSRQSGGVQVMLMGFNMTVPMVGWMRYRGHNWARDAEMAASMIVPSALAATLAWAGALSATGALALQHVVMIPAMLAVMLWRYDEYSHAHS